MRLVHRLKHFQEKFKSAHFIEATRQYEHFESISVEYVLPACWLWSRDPFTALPLHVNPFTEPLFMAPLHRTPFYSTTFTAHPFTAHLPLSWTWTAPFPSLWTEWQIGVKNITFPQLRLLAVTIHREKCCIKECVRPCITSLPHPCWILDRLEWIF